MSRAFTQIDLSSLAAPDVVETLDYETVLAAMIADLQGRDPVFTALLESDPAFKILEVAAYREVLLRQRVNDAARSVMLAYAGGGDLDHLAAFFGVSRLVVDEGDPEASPPVEAVYEGDDRLRSRVQLALEGYNTAGSAGSYCFHALSASPDVADVSVMSPEPGTVRVYVMPADGASSVDLLNTVRGALTAEDVRPLTDVVEVVAAEVVSYSVNAVLRVRSGPDPVVVRRTAEDALTAYTAARRRIGYDIPRSGLFGALSVPGVDRVDLAEPAGDLILGDHQVGQLAGMAIRVERIDG